MRKHQIFKVSLLFVMALIELPILAQGVIVFKKDGTQVKYPYEVIDSIVTYKYDESIKDDVTKQVAQAIDLGLSVKWASHNVGAAVPEEYGSYYSAGEIKEKNSYGIKDYLYYHLLDSDTMSLRSGSAQAQITINNTTYQIAKVLAYDSDIDLAVLQVNATFQTYAKNINYQGQYLRKFNRGCSVITLQN